MHILSDYVPFITKEVDYVLYLTEFVVMLFVYRAMKHLTSEIKVFEKIRKMFRILILCEFVEMYYAFMIGNSSLGIILKVFAVIYILKVTIEIPIYYLLLLDLQKDKYDAFNLRRIEWCNYNFLIFIMIMFLIFMRLPMFLYLVYALFGIRVLIIFKRIKLIADAYDNDCCKISSIKEVTKLTKLDIGKLTIACAFVVATLFARYTYEDFDVKEHINDEETYTNIYKYKCSNLMPEWTGLRDYRYGMYSFVNKIDTGSIYRNEVFYDHDKGLVYDGNGHILDEEFNVLFDTPKCMQMKKSFRQIFLGYIIDWCGAKDKNRSFFNCLGPVYTNGGLGEICDNMRSPEYNQFFAYRSGLGGYYSEFYNRYGLMNDEGKAVHDPGKRRRKRK